MFKKLGGFLLENRNTVLLVAAILLASFFLRIFNTGHVLSYDEAWNANTMVSVSEGAVDDLFFDNYYRHPPIYNSIGVVTELMTGAERSGLAGIMEIVSILFSLGLVFTVFLCGKEWFGQEAGLFAAALFALMPAARAYDTIIKPESLTVLLVMLFLYFFFKERYFIAGLLLGLAALSKEIFIFAPLALAVYLLVTWRKERFKGLLLSVGTAALASFWWYLFMANSRGEFVDFFLGRSQEAINWGRSWSYYFTRMPSDLGWIVLALVVFACILFVYELTVSSTRHQLSDDTPLSMSLFCIIFVLVTYGVLSFSHGKPPWMIYAALPAAALLGGWSLQEILRLFENRRIVGFAVVILLLAAALSLSLITGFSSFMRGADPTFDAAENHKRVAEYLNENGNEEAVAMFRVNDFSPNLAFYLKSYEPGGVYELPASMFSENEFPEPGEYSILLFRRDSSSGDILNWIEYYLPEFLVIRPGYPTTDGVDAADLLKEYIEPVEIENIWIFSGKGITGMIDRGLL